MHHIETETVIHAPVERVWAILTDFAAYPDWNPFMHVQGEARAGTSLQVTMFPEGMGPQRFKPEVLKAEPGREFRWLGKLFVRGLFDGEHYFLLEPAGEGKTRLKHGEYFRGILSGMLLGMIGDKTVHGFEKMNLALRQRAEGAAS